MFSSRIETDMRRRWVGVLLAVMSLVLIGQGRAAAHSELVDSDPADGASLSAAPSMVTLTFSEAVADPAFIVVTAPDGTRVSAGDADTLDDEVTQRLNASAAKTQAGSWTVAYRVLPTDGHPVTGELAFTVRADAGRNHDGAQHAEAGGKERSGSGHTHSGEGTAGSTDSHAGAHLEQGGSGWRQYAHWAQLPLTVVALGGLYLWSARRARSA